MVQALSAYEGILMALSARRRTGLAVLLAHIVTFQSLELVN